MKEYRYPIRFIMREASKSGGGAILCAVPLLTLDGLADGVKIVLALISALFVIYSVTTLRRGKQIVVVDDEAIRITRRTSTKTLRWDAMTGFDLRFYRLGRDRTTGWMQLRLSNGSQTLRIESSLDGFGDVLKQAAGAAEQAGLELTDTARFNLDAYVNPRPETASAFS